MPAAVVVAPRAVEAAATHAALLEICVPNCRAQIISAQLFQELLIPVHKAESRASPSFRMRNPDGWEWRCYMSDPDGYIIEVGQYTQLAIDWFNNHR
jgi:hypothetical protein